MKGKSTKSALLMSFTSLLLCFAMLIGCTFAWFTDSVTSGVNKIQAGNLDVEVTHTNAKVSDETVAGATNLFRDKDGNEMKWEPGAVSYETFTVKNLGSLALKYNLAMNITDYNAVTGTSKTLKDALKVMVLTTPLTSVTRDSVAALNWTGSDVKTLDQFTKDGGKLYPVDTEGKISEETFQVIVYWQPTDNDNQWNVNNGKSTTDGAPLFISFGINVVATQLNHETDSFNDEYDKGLLLPDMPDSINKTFVSNALVLSAGGTSYDVSETVIIKNTSNEADTTVATMEKEAAAAIGNKMKELATDRAADSDLSTVIQLSMQTEDDKTTATSITINIDLTAVATYTNSNGESKTIELNAADTDEVLRVANKLTKAEKNIGANLKDVAVKHSGVPMEKLASATDNTEGYYYDPASGLLTMKFITASPFEISFVVPTPVATIGEKGYATLEQALSAARDGDTIKLMQNVTLTSQFSPAANITLDLNGKTLNGDAIKYPVKINKNTEVVFTDSVGTGLLTQNYTSTSCDMFEIYGKLTVNGGNYYTNGTYGIFFRNSGCDLTINDGVFTNASKIVGGSSGTVQYNGGYYSVQFACPEGYTMKPTTLNGKTYYVMVVVTAEDAVASITRGEKVVYFAALADAIKAAGATDTVVIEKDATLTEGYTFNKAVVINLNGHTVTPALESCESLNYYVEINDNVCTVKEVGNWSANAASAYSTEVDETNKVVTISNAAELALFAKQVNSGTIGAGYTVLLTNDINLKENIWDAPIGQSNRFSGTFNGQGHTISNMKATKNPSYGNGLFADMTGGAVIKNFTIDNAYVSSSGNIYGIVSGYAYGTVTFEDITVKNSYISGYGKVGGILGMAADPGGTTYMKNCTVENTTIRGAYNCGGLIGLAQNAVELSGCTTSNVVWQKVGYGYMDINAKFTNVGTEKASANTDETVAFTGTYWKYSGFLYAAWSDYFNDYYVDGQNSEAHPAVAVYKATIDNKEYRIADGWCHNK